MVPPVSGGDLVSYYAILPCFEACVFSFVYCKVLNNPAIVCFIMVSPLVCIGL